MLNHELALSLEEFGLSRYEGKVYLTLLGKGPLSVSELAYYAGVPRTKVYSTLTKLTKKGLTTISQDKPLICTAVPPEDAFGELLSAQENKVSVMKSMISKLQKISEINRPYGSEEHRYLTLGPDSVLNFMNELILDAEEEIVCIVDSWGLRIISQCKNTMLKSISNKISIKILASKDCLDNYMLALIPYGSSVRIGDVGANMFLFDNSMLLIINSSSGKGVFFRSAQILSSFHSRIFDIAWANGAEPSSLIPLGKETARLR